MRCCPKCWNKGDWWVILEARDANPTDQPPIEPVGIQIDEAIDVGKPSVDENPRFERLRGQLAEAPPDPRDLERSYYERRIGDAAERGNRAMLALLAVVLCGPIGLLVLLSDSRRSTNWGLVLVVIVTWIAVMTLLYGIAAG